jgi:glycosyltransferase involved in cell wall biosynthesis
VSRPLTNRDVRAAFVQDFLTVEGGGERVGLVLANQLLPGADIYTSFFDPAVFGGAINRRRVHTWPLQRVIGGTKRFRPFLPLYPPYFGRMDLSRYDLVVSSSIAFAHAVRTAPNATHVSYVHTPMRYAWDLDTYLTRSSLPLPARVAARTLRPWLQRWDRATAARPDALVANSTVVAERIRRLWGRDAQVINPPVDTSEIRASNRDDGFLLVAARMLAYRRLDLAVAAATRLGRELIVVGDGPERARLKSLAGPTVQFRGWVDRSALIDLFERCHAYVVPGLEDFGIAPVEAMAAGKPVIAFRGGGVTETVIDGQTGVFFDRQDVDSAAAAMERVEGLRWDPARIRSRAVQFDTSVFLEKWRQLLRSLDVDRALFTAPPATADRGSAAE